MTPETVHCFVDGAWAPAIGGRTAPDTSPATGEVIAHVAQGGTADVHRAVAAAGHAQAAWAADPAARAAVLTRAADVVRERAEALAQTCTLDQGKPLAESRDEVAELEEHLRLAAAGATRDTVAPVRSVVAGAEAALVRRPVGVVGVITPWNWPYTMPAELVAPALAAGNAVVWVPAPSTSLCARELTDCLAAAGLPAGVLNVVPGPGPVVGSALARHAGVHGVGFIGSTATGAAVAAAAAGKPQVLELGGNGPLVVLEDADLDAAVAATLTACFLCAGQSCTAGERILVHRDVADEFLDRLVARTREEIRLGDPFDPATTLGPLNNEATAAKMDAHVTDALARGAQLRLGGERDHGLYWPATVLADVPLDALAMTDETFGPIAPIARIDSLEHAIEVTNASPYALVAAIFTADPEKGRAFAAAVRAGWVNVNLTTNHWEPHLPFGGGPRSSSGLGRVGGDAVLDAFSDQQTLIVA